MKVKEFIEILKKQNTEKDIGIYDEFGIAWDPDIIVNKYGILIIPKDDGELCQQDQ